MHSHFRTSALLVLYFALCAAYGQGLELKSEPKISIPVENIYQGQSRIQSLISPSALLAFSTKVVGQVDSGDWKSLWSGTSPVIKKVVAERSFLEGLNQLKQSFGNTGNRLWVAIYFQQMNPSPAMPGGVFANIEFDTEFETPSKTSLKKRELVSFRLDEDGTWRFAGYLIK